MLGTGNRILVTLMLLGVLSATADAGETIKESVCMVADFAKGLMASVVFALVIMAAIVYAAGQVLGAETRARASVWATAMVVGAVMGILIYVLLPPILSTMLYGDANMLQELGCG
ncbi:MAG: hypothetical protein AB1657_00165 [Candidatus Micrarchaeota archaeon]